MQIERRVIEEQPFTEAPFETMGDPSPETNLSDGSAALAPSRSGSRAAAEEALGPQKLWAEHVTSLAVWPAALLMMTVSIAGRAGHALPTVEGLVLGVLVAALLGYAIGGRVPRALAYARRVPLILLAAAAGGLGASIGAITLGTVVLASPMLRDAEAWVLAGASFGLAYAGLLLVPALLARLGRVSGGVFAVARMAAMLLAALYAGWNA